MGLEVKANFSAKALERIRAAVGTSGDVGRPLLNAISRQTLYFIGSIQKNQMSGRRGGIYLNVDTGHLRRSWFPRTWVEGGQIHTKAFTNVPYAAIHQYGGVIHRQARQSILSFNGRRGRFVSPSRKAFQSKATGQRQMKVTTGAHDIRIPKRLFIIEQFESEMPGRYRKAIMDVIRKAGHGD